MVKNIHAFAISLILITNKLWIINVIKHELNISNIFLYLVQVKGLKDECFTQANYCQKMSFVWSLPPKCGIMLSLVPSRCSGSEALPCGYCIANIPHFLHRSALSVSFPRTNCELCTVCHQQYGVSPSLCPCARQEDWNLTISSLIFKPLHNGFSFPLSPIQPGCMHIISCLWKVLLHKVHM